METRLIIVDGHCSVGKSSLSKSLWKQLNREQEAYWLHEECEHHPIRQDEFSFGDLNTAEGMELNRTGMLRKWADFREAILSSGKVCVTEGCLLHAYDRYFIHSTWNEEEISRYYTQVLEVIRGLNPLIVLLYRPDLRSSLEKAFVVRGKWWRDLILKRDDQHVYFKDHEYMDENSMFAAVEFEQKRMLEIFEGLECLKIKIDTSEEQWDEYLRDILSRLGARYARLEPHPCEDLQQYAGTYRWREGTEGDQWVIQYDEGNQCLFTTLFWPEMHMRCIAEDVFELISFPVEIHFQKGEHGLQFQVRGNYDWEYNDQVFVRV